MAKRKISATINPGTLAEAAELTGDDNVSAVFDRAVKALIDLEQERRWLAAPPNDDLPGSVPPDLSELPWEERFAAGS